MSNRKTLFVLRHAKSSWDEPEKDDFDRALKNRGISDVKLLSREIAPELKNLDAIFSSPAIRAIHTAILFAQAAAIPLNIIHIMEELYETNEIHVEKMVKALPNNLKTVMIVGHNPTSTQLVNRFLRESIFNMPTSGLVRLSFNSTDWNDIAMDNLESSSFDFPKNNQ